MQPGSLRAGTVLAAFMALTVPLMPLQALFVRISPRAARAFPHWYHRQVCRLLGVRLHIDGALARDAPVLVISNHTSWLDIPVLSAVAPVSFVAKKEVGSWPFVSALARLQRTVFVDRERRSAAGESAGEIASRLAAGDAIVLFAEGTSSDGNRVLPFKTALFGAAKPSANGAALASAAVVQTLAIVYTRVHGVPLARDARPLVGWYGDMEMTSHAWDLLRTGPLDVRITIGPPVALDAYADRKDLARRTEAAIRESVARVLRGRTPAETVQTVAPAQGLAERPRRAAGKWQ